MIPLNLKNKITKHGFMLACDTVYLNNWTKPLFFSIQKYCPWAHIHIHVFDPVPSDIVWLSSHNCSYSTENTPSEFTDIASKGLYWSVARYARVLEIYTDDTLVIDLDVDSVVVNSIPQKEFLKDLESSWVPTRLKGGQIKSLASAVGFGADRARYIFAELLIDAYKNAAKLALEASGIEECEIEVQYSLSVSHEETPSLMNALNRLSFRKIKTKVEMDFTIEISIKEEMETQLLSVLKDLRLNSIEVERLAKHL